MGLYDEAEIRQMARRLMRLERENAAYRELYQALQMFINNPDGLWMSVVVAYDTARKALEDMDDRPL